MTPSMTVLKKLRRMTKDELVEQIIKLSDAFEKQKIVNQIIMNKLKSEILEDVQSEAK